MGFITADLVQETTAVVGTGAATLLGATTGKITLGAVMANGDTAFVVIDNGAGQFEGGLVTWNTGGTITRTAANVLFGSSGAGALVNFSAGTKTVTIAPISSRVVQLNDTMAMTLPCVSSEPVTPPTGFAQVYVKELAGGRGMLKVMSDDGLDHWIQPAMFNNKIGRWNPVGNSTTAPVIDCFPAVTSVGSIQARAFATTNMRTRAARFGWDSSGLAGSLAGFYVPSARWTLGVPQTPPAACWGGFLLCKRWCISDATVQTVARMFVGMSSSTSAPTNVEPSTLTNCIGVGKAAADTNYHLFYGGSAAQTPIDLGASFPFNNTDVYELYIYAPGSKNDTVFVRLVNVTTGASVNTTITAATPGTQLPNNTTWLTPRAWRCNNTAAAAVGLDIVSLYIEADN